LSYAQGLNGPSENITTYAATPETVVHQTVGIEVMTAASLVTTTERMAAYIYEDLRELTARAHISLADIMQMPPVYTNDPNLFQRLLCLDIERLFRDRHTTDLALFLYDPNPDAGGRLPLRYRTSYHVVRTIDWASAAENPDAIDLPSSHITRHGGQFYSSNPTSGAYQRRFALAVKWNPQTASTREIGMRYPHYHFHWSPAGSIVFNDDALPAIPQDPSPPSSPLSWSASPASPQALPPSLAGTSVVTGGDWTQNMIQHTLPNAYRQRPENKPSYEAGN
jgi:hypothetical protein